VYQSASTAESRLQDGYLLRQLRIQSTISPSFCTDSLQQARLSKAKIRPKLCLFRNYCWNDRSVRGAGTDYFEHNNGKGNVVNGEQFAD
jgi:hypothetical protein